LRVFDSQGTVSLGRHAAGLQRADESSDRRFVAALTTAGDILVWDLHAVRPMRITDNGQAQMQGLTEHYLWLSAVLEGVSRIDLETSKEERVFAGVITGDVVFDDAERWLAVSSKGTLSLVDLTTRRILTSPTLAFAPWGHDFVALTSDGDLETWSPGDDHFHKRAHVPIAGFSQLAADGPVAVVGYNDHVDRIDLATSAEDRVDRNDISGMIVDANGTVWLLAGTECLRWPIGGRPVMFALSAPPKTVTVHGDTLVFYSGGSITVVQGSKHTTIAHASKAVAWAGGSTLATYDAGGIPSIVDLDTGLVFTLPTRATGLVVNNDHVATMNDRVELWNLSVPRDPVALRAWLATITNAKPISDTSDAYAWP
jgi:hypothetical protein